MKILCLFWFFNVAILGSAHAVVKLEPLARTGIESSFKFQKTRIGGLSGIVYNAETKRWIAVSDDRGRVQEPRFYELDLRVNKRDSNWELTVEPKDVHFFHPKNEKRWKKGVLDLEGVTLLPWGNFLFSSEGDNNQKPRVLPTLLDVKPDGTWARDFALPDEALPPVTGVASKGIQNNRGPEGLTVSDDGRFIWVGIESPLIQEREAHPHRVPIYQYEMPEAWVIRPTKTFFYELEPGSPNVLLSERGVSELFWLKGRTLLVMERALEVSVKGLNFDVKLFQVELPESGQTLKKELVLDLQSTGWRVTNFEGLAKGPTLPDGRATLVVMSDNNFQKSESTEFWLFAIETEK